MVVDKEPFLQDIGSFRTEFVDGRKDILQAYNTVEAANAISNEFSILEKGLKSENLCDSENQTLCNPLQQLEEKLDKDYAEWTQTKKPEDGTQGFVDLSDTRSYYRDLVKLYGHSMNCGNQTSLVTSTSSSKKDPNQSVIENNRRFKCKRRNC